MKLIDLLNKIANGEEIKKFKYNKRIFEYDEHYEDWYDENDSNLTVYCELIKVDLNKEVEILEEEKKTPTLNDIRESYGLPRIEEKKTLTKMAFVYKVEDEKQNANNARFTEFINEIIDHLNSKGE